MKKGIIFFSVFFIFLLNNAWAENSAMIQELKGGLPAEVAARAAADADLQYQIDTIELTPGPTLGIYDSLSLESSGGLAPGDAGGMPLYNLGDVGIGTSSVATGVKLDVSGGNLEIDHGAHMGAGTSDVFIYDDDPMGYYSLGWKSDSWFSYGNTAWLAGYGGIKFFTGGMQPALSIGYWGQTWFSNDIIFDNINSGIILRSPNSSCFKLTVNDDGSLNTESVTCP